MKSGSSWSPGPRPSRPSRAAVSGACSRAGAFLLLAAVVLGGLAAVVWVGVQ